MKKIFLLIPFLLFADVNPFNAGNLNSPSPYGLTPDEKAILANKKQINKLTQQIQTLQGNIAKIKFNLSTYEQNINDKLSAFPTMIDEINSAMSDIENLKKEYNQTQSEIVSLKAEIKSLKGEVNSIENNLTNIKESIKEIITVQNQNFIELKQSIIDILNKIKKLQKKPISPQKAFELGKNYFYKGMFDKAKEFFTYSLSKNYMPATSSFYLGEIAYKQKKYKEALAYYKKSVKLYPKKTSFTALLLYHSGKSFLYLNEKKAAKLAFEKLISDFPHSKYAKLAKKYLVKLK